METSLSANRTTHRPDPDRVTVRESDSDDDGDTFRVRMPVASTGEVRNEGDDPLTREEVDGMRQQIAESDIGVFPQHGSSNVVDADRYSQFQRLGDWTDPEVQTRGSDEADLLMATAEMPDPDTVSEATGEYRQMLAIVKEQAERGIGINSSIGWADDEDAPGGVDLLEVSLVGIGADPRTNTEDEAAGLVARKAVQAGADPDDLLARVESALADDTNDDPDATPDDESDTNMDSDESTPETGDTNDEQDAPDPDTESDDSAGETGEDRAPDDVSEDDFGEMVGEHYDGLDGADVTAALTDAGGEFVGVQIDTLSWFIGDVVDVSASEVGDVLEGLMDASDDDGDEGEQGDKPDMDDDEDDDEDDDRDLAAEVDQLRQELTEIRENGGTPTVDDPEPDAEQSADDDPDTDEDRDADTDAEDSEETDDDTRATGPDWRA